MSKWHPVFVGQVDRTINMQIQIVTSQKHVKYVMA